MTSYAELSARFRPVFDRITEGAQERDAERVLPHAQVAWLDEARFGALRVPESAGGFGASIETLAHLLVDLAAADSNVAHLYRSHLGFVETIAWQPPAVREDWYARVVAGETVGNASTEIGGNALGTLNTRLTEQPDGTYVLEGKKYYTTGTIFSDWTRVSAGLTGHDSRVFALVRTDAPGVTVVDDWDGFGQKLTGTGTTVLEDVAVAPEHVWPRTPKSQEALHEAAFFQLVLLCVQAGIARAARDEAAGIVAGRTRTFNTGSGVPFREDPLILAEIGQIASKAYVCEATVLAAARALDVARTADGRIGLSHDPADAPQEAIEAELAVEAAHVGVPELAIEAAQALFRCSGASATSARKGHDRHWRNAQTVATHNPIPFRARSLGDFHVNGTVPEGLNAIGDATRGSATSSVEGSAS
ncbi:acyl-CoA dehydrogenase family protein [Brevibacterium litoralis]|uniref:acyl-CoA dehydrogenase family protein n=1 Tax=Brevibacterium litoralis TaxID=3138935 RepID=UPI0032EC49C1